MARVITIICGFILLLSSCEKDDSNNVSNNISSNERQVVDIVNNERAKLEIAPLEIDESLMKSCDIRAEEIVTTFSHKRPDGQSCFTVIKTSYGYAAENIAYGQKNAEEVMSSWMNSEGHRNNIISEKYSHIGVGCYEHNNRLYWVQLFISKK